MEVSTDDPPKDSTENAVPEPSANVNATPPPLQTKKTKKEERSKKEDKSVDQFMKSLNSVPSLEEKLSLVCKKYVQVTDDNKKLQFYIKQSDKRYALLLKEKDQLQLEFNKAVLVKSKLENLCRELQKQNKAIKEESLLKIREEEERRKETQAKFQNTLSEITAMLQQNNEKNAKLRDDNISMSENFKGIMQQYKMREQQVDKMAKQMAVESQLSDAKHQKAILEHQADKEIMKIKIEELKKMLAQSETKILELQGIEKALRGELAVYTEKYDDFQSALTKSNKLFTGFKEQMEQMSSKIKKLEKESLTWKSRWETSQTALLDMCSERQASEERIAATTRQLQHMQGLCRTLQAERTALLNTLKENNIERPPLPTPPPAPAPAPPLAPASDAKVEAMAANCVQLRQSLAHLQSQLNVLQNNKEEPAKPEKQKKSKNKKKDKKSKESPEKELKPESDDAAVIEQPENGAVQADVIEVKELTQNTTDQNVMEAFMQAINNANVSLCDLEVVSDDKNDVSNVETTAANELNGAISSAESQDGSINKNSFEEVLKIEDMTIENINQNSNEEVSHILEVKSISDANDNTQVTA